MAKDLTQGRIMPMLIKFTIPLILGNIFQLTYNAVDSIIVGRFVGKEALAAVGICNPITTLIILFLNGLCMGASILMGNYFGGKKMDTLSSSDLSDKHNNDIRYDILTGTYIAGNSIYKTNSYACSG